jgi:hypothetical protein
MAGSSDDELGTPVAFPRWVELVIAWVLAVVGVPLVVFGALTLVKFGLGAMLLVTGSLSFGVFLTLIASQLFVRTPLSPAEIMSLRGWSWFIVFLIALGLFGGLVDWRAAVCPFGMASFCLLVQPAARRHYAKIKPWLPKG